MGLYVLWVPTEVGGGNEYIYTGMSRTCLRRRLLQHLRKSEKNPQLRHELQLFRDVVLFSVGYTQNREETRPLERDVIAYWKPLHQQAGVRCLVPQALDYSGQEKSGGLPRVNKSNHIRDELRRLILDFPDRTEFPEHEALWDGANYKPGFAPVLGRDGGSLKSG